MILEGTFLFHTSPPFGEVSVIVGAVVVAPTRVVVAILKNPSLTS